METRINQPENEFEYMDTRLTHLSGNLSNKVMKIDHIDKSRYYLGVNTISS